MINQLVITANQDTVLKKKPCPASELEEKAKVKVEKGRKYTIVWKSGKKDGHIKVSLSHQAGNWYVFFPHWDGLDSVPIASHPISTPKEAGVFKTAIQSLNLSQPDSRTCQAAAIGMAVGDKDIYGIRNKLDRLGVAGDPAVMGRVIKSYGVNYSFDGNASLSEVRENLKKGVFCITHGWFTGSGHVICLDGLKEDPQTLSYSFDVKDPWSEFDGVSWSYNKPNIKFFDGYYSSFMIYASCVASHSVNNARELYNRRALDSSRKGMWVHYIKP